jgi:hypothetical protein
VIIEGNSGCSDSAGDSQLMDAGKTAESDRKPSTSSNATAVNGVDGSWISPAQFSSR